MKKTLLALVVLLLASCQDIFVTKSVAPEVTVSWALGSTDGRTLLPTNFPMPATYGVSLTPTTGTSVTKTGLSSQSWTISGLEATVYAVTVTGFDGSGGLLVQGTGTADLTVNASASVPVTLRYLVSGAGTGQIHLNITSALVTSSAVVQIVDPSGTLTTPTLTSDGAGFTYMNSSAAVGNYRIVFILKTAAQTALKMESLLVARNVDTAATVAFSAVDFANTVIPVSGIGLNTSTAPLAMGGSLTLNATLQPVTASNPLILWSSDTPRVATVDQNGVVTPVAPGTASISVASADNPSAKASCQVTVSYLAVVYNGNEAGGGSVPTDSTNYTNGQSAIVLGNTETLTKTGFLFRGWNTAADGKGTNYQAGDTLSLGSTGATLYALWKTAYTVTYLENGMTGGTVPAIQAGILGDPLTLAGIGTMAKANHAFVCWNPKTDGTGTVYQPGDSYTVGTTNLTLYAFWNTVVYNGNGATGGTVPIETTIYPTTSANIFARANEGNLIKPGYQFMGWNPKADGSGTTYTAATTTFIPKPAGSITLYAKWTPVYAVTYDANGAESGTVPATSLNFTGAAMAVQDNTGNLSRAGYYFYGWNAKADGSGTQYDVGTTFSIYTADVTYYARWVPKVVSVQNFASSTSTLALTNSGDFYASDINYFGVKSDYFPKMTKVMSGVKAVKNGITYGYGSQGGWIVLLKNDGTLLAAGVGLNYLVGTATTIPYATVATGVDAFAATNSSFLFLVGNGLYVSGWSNFGQGAGFSATFPTLIRSDVSRVWAGGDRGAYYTSEVVFIETTDGQLWSTGANTYGGLGLGTTTTDITTFTKVPGVAASTVAEVETNGNSSFILLKDGTALAAGLNANGQLGLGDTTNRSSFTPITALGNDVASISCQAGHRTLVVKTNGDLYAFGSGWLATSSSPVLALTNVRSCHDVSYIGYGRVRVVNTDGSLWFWNQIGSSSWNSWSGPTRMVF